MTDAIHDTYEVGVRFLLTIIREEVMKKIGVALVFGLAATLLSGRALGEEPAPPFTADSYVALGAYRGMVEEHASGILRSLHVLAESNELRSAKEVEFKPMLSRFSEDLPTDATTWFVFPDGNYFATQVAGMAEQNLKDRHYFPILMSGKKVFGDLVISKSTGHRSVIVAVPVVSQGKVVGGVGVSLRVHLLSDLVDKRMELPETEYFYALERDTRIVLHRKSERMFKTPTDVGDEALGEQFKRELQKERGRFEYELNGKKIASIFEFSPALGWYFFIAKEVKEHP